MNLDPFPSYAGDLLGFNPKDLALSIEHSVRSLLLCQTYSCLYGKPVALLPGQKISSRTRWILIAGMLKLLVVLLN